MAIHLKEMKIDSFKGIKDLNLKNLNHINILTGDNNSGKTSILEALSTMHSPQDIGSWIRSARYPRMSYPGMFYNAVYNLFPVDDGVHYPIRYEYLDCHDKTHSVIVRAEIEETQISGLELREMDGVQRVKGGAKEEDNMLIETNCMHLSIGFDSDELRDYAIYDVQTRISHFVSKQAMGIPTNYVSPTDHAYRFSLKDVLSNQELYEEMIMILKEFDDNIVNIISVETGNSNISTATEYIVLTHNHKRALPLSSYGDGMKKTLLLLSAILQSKNGILLLDEFETAIHTSAMDHIFSWLMKCARELKVQVFLTSHSKEAINKVLRCDDDLKSMISYYTLFNYEGKNLVRYLSGEEAIKMQDEGGLELR